MNLLDKAAQSNQEAPLISVRTVQVREPCVHVPSLQHATRDRPASLTTPRTWYRLLAPFTQRYVRRPLAQQL